MNPLAILALLIVVSGFFALAEMGLASSRKGKLRQLADAGDREAARALQIKDAPSRLLATTQTAITAAALLAGIFGESALARDFEGMVDRWLPFAATAREEIALTVTVVLVTAATIVFGEIIPKRIALAYPEQVSRLVAPALGFVMWLLAPLTRLLSWTADIVLRLLPLRSAPEMTSVDDILAAVDEGERAGSIGPEESHLLGNVFRLEDRRVAAVMTPAKDVACIDLLRPRDANLEMLRERPHGRYPVCRGDLQQMIGLAESRALLRAAVAGDIDFGGIAISPPLFVPSALTLIDLLRTFRSQGADFAFVVNEFGQTEGIVTLGDVFQTVAGDMMPRGSSPDSALAVQREDGSWLLDGLLPLDEMQDKLEIRELPEQALGNYHTVGGFVIAMMARIPRRAEKFECAGWSFEVVDMDRNRVDEVLASRLPTPDRP